MKVSEIRALSGEELNKQLQSACQELLDLRVKASTRQLVNNRQIPQVRRRIATIKTILREREMSTSQ